MSYQLRDLWSDVSGTKVANFEKSDFVIFGWVKVSYIVGKVKKFYIRVYNSDNEAVVRNKLAKTFFLLLAAP